MCSSHEFEGQSGVSGFKSFSCPEWLAYVYGVFCIEPVSYELNLSLFRVCLVRVCLRWLVVVTCVDENPPFAFRCAIIHFAIGRLADTLFS